MATEKQIAANRRNSLLSSGPKTQAGPHSIHLLSRYARTSYRSMRKNLQLLNEMQSSRRAIEQATLLGAGFPEPNGFEFANDKIAA